MAAELETLGVGRPSAVPGGVEFDDAVEALYRVALRSGLASGLLVRLGEFEARRFEQVVRGVAALPWRAWIGRYDPVQVRVTARKSRLYHTTAIAERVLRGLHEAVGARPADDASTDAWRVAVRLVNDRCAVSLDLTDEPLYRRGYRLATAKAPLRPDLARALLVVSGWDPQTPLIDPFCGAGTICIEAAAMARGLPPGRLRNFAFMRAAFFDADRWERIRTSGMKAVLTEAPALVWGSDRDAGAVRAAKENAERAGVDIQWEVAPLGRASSVRVPPADVGALISNPPYGRRTGDLARLRNLYQSLGEQRRRLPKGWRMALVVADGQLARATQVRLRSALLTDHGGTKVRFMVETPGDAGLASSPDG